ADSSWADAGRIPAHNTNATTTPLSRIDMGSPPRLAQYLPPLAPVEYPKVSEWRSEPLPRGEHLSPYEKEVPLKAAAASLVVASLVLCLDAARPQSGASPAGSLVVGTDAKLLLELETSLHTRTTRVGDRAEF